MDKIVEDFVLAMSQEDVPEHARDATEAALEIALELADVLAGFGRADADQKK